MSSINEFTICGPVYMSGIVYKQTNEGWKESTTDDTTDCICSVKASGKWNEYVGIGVSIDENHKFITFTSHGDVLFKVEDSNKYKIGDIHKCITFGTHGDYLVKVNDTTLYNVGDEIFIDDDNVLKILSVKHSNSI